MALPTQKRTKSSKRKRALNFKLNKVRLSSCPKCKKPVLSFQVCSFCGTYKGREIVKKEKKKKEKKKEKEKKK